MRGSKKVEDFLTLSEYKNKYFVVVVLIFITLPLSMPVFQQSFEGLKNAKKSINWLHSPTYPSKAVGPGDLGGDRTIKFIKNNLPPKSIYYTNTGYLILPVMVDGYVPASGPAAYTSYDFLYHKNEDFPLLDKFKCIYAAKIEYLIFGHDPNRPNLYPVFDRYPEYFEKLYDDNVSIYKVNLEAIAPFVEDDVRLGLTPVCGY